MQIEFPHYFLWGAATSSYQTEGGNLNSDWSDWEKSRKLQPAADACKHYQQFPQDFQLASDLGLKALRFSIEWSRICPRPGEVCQRELSHYKAVIKSLKDNGLKPFLTLHHFTNPRWFAHSGGWLNSKNIDYFLQYLSVTAQALKEDVDYWLIFNEPLVYLFNGYIKGIWPPGKTSLPIAIRAFKNIISAYKTGYWEIKNICKHNPSVAQVSLAKHMIAFSPCPNSKLGGLSAALRDKLFNTSLCAYLKKNKCLDFLALNYYYKEYTKFSGPLGEECSHKHKERKNYLGWNIYPQGLYQMLIRSKKLNLPIMITENGTAEESSEMYQDYMVKHLKAIADAIADGVDVRGYFWWSLIDNFEWDKGFEPRFGLAHVDYSTFARKLKPFAFRYAKICKENMMTYD
ncbi:MAG: glycoside hydrolase family 1 protein [Candidatus Omnitrophica bacterium]|nr:glycoside hydrolase family 1 protein [Candidatus Omnitrophota bacterium]